MKKIFLTYIVTLAFTSCSTNETPKLSEEKEVAIAFGEPKTRAEITNANQIINFGVFADKNTGNPGTTGATQFTDYLFTNENVFRQDETTDWDYTNKQYWVYDRDYHFFAYYPYTNNAERKTITENQVNTDVYQIPFTTPTNADTDLLTAYVPVSTVRNNDFEGFPESVDFTFTHALSKISVKVAKNNTNSKDKIVVTSVSFTGVKKSGVYICHRHGDTKKWIPYNEEATFSVNNLNAELTTDGVSVMGQDKGLLLIPQVIIENSINISIVYSFYNYDVDSDKHVYAYQNTINAPLLTDQVNEWIPSKNYIYKVTLDAEENEILFGKPTITGWGTEKPVGGTIIIQ